MSSYVALMTEDPTNLHAEPEHHISTSDRLEVNFSLVLVLLFSVFCPLLLGMLVRELSGE